MGFPNEISASTAPEVVTSTLPEVTDEKISPVTRAETNDLGKVNAQIDDEAGIIAVRALESGPAEAEISRRVLRKIDLYILPFLCITYGKTSRFQEES